MKLFSRSIILFFLVSGICNAQIVLGPTATGNANFEHLEYYNLWPSDPGCHETVTGPAYYPFSIWTYDAGATLKVTGALSRVYWGYTAHMVHCSLPGSSYSWSQHDWCLVYGFHTTYSYTIIEFDISGLNGAGVTIDNFQTAHLGGLEVTASSGITDVTLVLNNLTDYEENGQVTSTDYFGAFGGLISTLCTTRPPVGTVYNDIDVTSQIYNDLFGTGSGQDYSGFSITTWCNSCSITFDSNTPTLTVTIIEPVPSLSNWGFIGLCTVLSLLLVIRVKRVMIWR